MNLAERVLAIAESQVGKKENPLGSNWGEPVASYLRSVGINFPASWCMAFVYWCFDKAFFAVQQKNILVKTGGVLLAYNKIPSEYKSGVPKVGSIFIQDHGKGLGHTGIVTSFDTRFIYTIEGNTNDTGSREGIEVCAKKRLRSTIKGYINVV